MARASTNAPKRRWSQTTTEAREGVTGHGVRYVLTIS